jgi:hypothetical protein
MFHLNPENIPVAPESDNPEYPLHPQWPNPRLAKALYYSSGGGHVKKKTNWG